MSEEPEDWDALAPMFDEEADHGLRDPVVRDAWRRLLLPLLPGPGCAVADIGCGTGSLSLLLAEAGCRVIGVDRSPAMLAVAERKAPLGAVPRPAFRVGDATAPLLPAGSFDVVLARHILFLLPDPDAVLERWAALLRPGGRLILIEGVWSTGAGIPSAECLALARRHRPSAALRQLGACADLWGKAVTDERYLVLA